ncbi:MAG: hypothetical protein ACRCZB_04275 [Bacteroidales bacterium]
MKQHEIELHRLAKRLQACERLKGDETTRELIELFFTAQGQEFCEKYNYPPMHLLFNVRGLEAARQGFYVNTPINIKNAKKVALIGEASIACLHYDNTERHEVVIMHGARVKIIAEKYAVVFVKNISGQVEIEERDSAIVRC